MVDWGFLEFKAMNGSAKGSEFRSALFAGSYEDYSWSLEASVLVSTPCSLILCNVKVSTQRLCQVQLCQIK